MNKIKLIFASDLDQMQERIDKWLVQSNRNVLNTSLIIDNNRNLGISIVYNEGPISL